MLTMCRYKAVSLLVICVQTTALVLLMRYSRANVPGPPYLASTAILLSETGKLVVIVAMLFCENGFSCGRTWRVFVSDVVRQPRETLRLVVPSFLYTVQNNLLFLALSNLNAATFQLTYQLKILVTALLSALMLKRRILPAQWLFLLLLVAGVVLVQMSATDDDSREGGRMAAHAAVPQDNVLGLVAVLLACLSSGYSGVYFEKLVKQGAVRSLSVRNLQLSCFSVPFSAAAVCLNDGSAVLQTGFFYGYNYYVLLVILLHTVGGIAVSFAVKYADNVLKGFATSISIVLSTAFSCVVEETRLEGGFLAGCFLVLASTVGFGALSTAAAGADKKYG